MSSTFIPYESVDYTYTINKALLAVFEARANVKDSMTFERYLATVEALYTILIPSLKSDKVAKLIEKAKARNPKFKSYTAENLKHLDEAVAKIIEVLNNHNLLLRGEKHTETTL